MNSIARLKKETVLGEIHIPQMDYTIRHYILEKSKLLCRLHSELLSYGIELSYDCMNDDMRKDYECMVFKANFSNFYDKNIPEVIDKISSD